jgi:arsenite-transporting ATPase
MAHPPPSPPTSMEQALAQLFRRRVLLVAGKGGVGRTTLSSALAQAAVQRGKRVLLAEFEEPAGFRASPLAGLYGMGVFPSTPQPVSEGVYGMTIQAELGIELFLTGLFKVPALSRLALRTPALRNMLRAGPSFHEMGLFYRMLMAIREQDDRGNDRFDLMIIDMPATGHALALTGLSSILLDLVRRGPIADALRDGRSVFYDPEQCAACVVTLPEPLPVSECLELIDGLHHSEMTVGAVIANRVPSDPFSPQERDALDAMLQGRLVRGHTIVERIRRAEGSMARLRDAVKVPLIQVPELDTEPVHRGVAEHLLGGAA